MPTTEDLQQLESQRDILLDDLAYIGAAIATLQTAYDNAEAQLMDIDEQIAECEAAMEGGEMLSAPTSKQMEMLKQSTEEFREASCELDKALSRASAKRKTLLRATANCAAVRKRIYQQGRQSSGGTDAG